MQRIVLTLALLASCVLLAVPSSAQAGYPMYPGGSFATWPNYYGWGASPYSLGQVPVPPYFALHPPVYYSMPVPRTYGYSPYAYPGTVETPEIVIEDRSAMIENPYVTPSATQPASQEQPAQGKIDTDQHSASSKPVIIENPFVTVSVAAHAEAPKQAN